MDIIDAHTHIRVHPDKEDLINSKNIGICCTYSGFARELNKNNVAGAIVIDDTLDDETPTGYNSLVRLAKKNSKIFPVTAVNPDSVSVRGIEKLRKGLEEKLIYGIKIYLGYYPRYATDMVYSQFYSMAGEYGCPVILHTGDTYGEEYLVKYAHPLQIDELAVNFKKTNFVIAHLGNPWIRDAAEVVYKNPNVFTDLSAFCIGQVKNVPKFVYNDIEYAWEYVNNPDKFLYGSDWPLVKMADYIPIIKKAIPEKAHNKVFYENTKRVFRLPL